ncbi:MAG TPA: glucose-6-phosphate dehydrogenase, partial [Ignavibacteria bacterium]|nr:glucose-6-phosphate dehydrogenase [Ignavibacteria bacterium]
MMNNLKSCNIVIFGASGDLTKRKLIPSLYALYKKNLLPQNFAITGISRSAMDNVSYRNFVR